MHTSATEDLRTNFHINFTGIKGEKASPEQSACHCSTFNADCRCVSGSSDVDQRTVIAFARKLPASLRQTGKKFNYPHSSKVSQGSIFSPTPLSLLPLPLLSLLHSILFLCLWVSPSCPRHLADWQVGWPTRNKQLLSQDAVGQPLELHVNCAGRTVKKGT